MPQNLTVINCQGKEEQFSFKKVYHSARRAGVDHKLAKQIAEKIEAESYPGIETRKIFHRIKSILDQQAPATSMRFSLKKGMRKLGPTGFPFEKYVKRVLENHGFKIKINQLVPGQCLSAYEIDFVGEDKTRAVFVGECKYRVAAGDRVDLEKALANYARFLDIGNGSFLRQNYQVGQKLKSLLVTNAKFTSQAIKYSRCMGVELLGWRYPQNQGLEYLIESKQLYPITILPSVTPALLQIFSQQQIMLAKGLLEHPVTELEKKLGLQAGQLQPLVKETQVLLEK
ncbi:hypothetical protein KKD62_04325 [Patescibacteria group bacterium]|nr:hypothetical protein [Patescibacteria group bacterium]MBU1931310.1 hypothetical protein [Patescibacteria group bacterium]